ncbi:MAG: hypothetical protein WCG85_25835 [Polyangia bacterium]
MRLKSACLLILLAGCDEGPPPFDELPLRDALGADPETVALLPEAARMALAARFEAARANDVAVDEIGEARTPAAMVVAVDRARQRRQAEPLMAGTIGNGLAQPMVDRATSPDTPGLPPVAGVSAAATAAIETLALETEAGTVVRALLAASGAQHLARVVGWPVGVVAIDDTIYVNAAWLVGLAPDAGENADGGSVAGSSSGGSGTLVASRPAGPGASLHTETATAEAPSSPHLPSKAVLRGVQFDAGEPSSSSPDNANPGDSCSACADACAASSADTGSSDSCDSSDDTADNGGDACNSTADDGGDACNAAADGSDSAANCQVSRGGGRKKSGTLVWLLAPLAFLLSRRQF